ncbi:uncharacterized protein VP01_1928g2 [Puccinia sorghi]|uniref:DUF913 domain-containing protein n=1 Tax=Puccinia sorghi TaxID=27349 RepID=A0A0L6VCL4_9BASI|nr:uncharacterized protein VP01_1928g2 [Puccinia sorghi]
MAPAFEQSTISEIVSIQLGSVQPSQSFLTGGLLFEHGNGKELEVWRSQPASVDKVIGQMQLLSSNLIALSFQSIFFLMYLEKSDGPHERHHWVSSPQDPVERHSPMQIDVLTFKQFEPHSLRMGCFACASNPAPIAEEHLTKVMRCQKVKKPQACAIISALATLGFSLIQGPRWTGKFQLTTDTDVLLANLRLILRSTQKWSVQHQDMSGGFGISHSQLLNLLQSWSLIGGTAPDQHHLIIQTLRINFRHALTHPVCNLTETQLPVFGYQIYPLAINMRSTLMHSKPTSSVILQEAGLAEALVDAIDSGIEPAFDVIAVIPSAGCWIMTLMGYLSLPSASRQTILVLQGSRNTCNGWSKID